MRDYSLNIDDSKKYILSYKIENKKIIIKLACGETYVIPYTEKNEAIIIDKMENQARHAKLKPLNILDKALAITNPLLLPVAIMNFANNGGWFFGICLVIIAGGAVYYPVKVITDLIKKRDIEKLKYFLDNKEELNENIDKSENMKLGVSRGAVKEIELQKNENKQPVNINNIDNYSLSDLKTIKDNIERFSSFGFDEDEEVLEDAIEEKNPVLNKSLQSRR